MRPVIRVLCALAWGCVFYGLAYQFTLVSIATWAGAREPDKYPDVCDAAFAAAFPAINPYLILGAVLLAAAGSWAGILPGTSVRPESPSSPGDGRALVAFRVTLGSVIIMLFLSILVHILRTDYDPMSK